MKRRTAISGYGKRHQRMQQVASQMVRIPAKMEEGLQIMGRIEGAVRARRRQIRETEAARQLLKHAATERWWRGGWFVGTGE